MSEGNYFLPIAPTRTLLHQNVLKMATCFAVAHTNAVTQFVIGRHRTPLKMGRASIQSR